MDKELALIIAEMLIKQDETTAQLKEVSIQVKEVTTHVKEVTTQVKEVVTEVKDVVSYLNQITDQGNRLISQVNGVTTAIQETNSILKDFMAISVKQWDQQQIFNEAMIFQLKEVKEVLIILAQVDTRLKALEEREGKFENRLSNIEKLLKAS